MSDLIPGQSPPDTYSRFGITKEEAWADALYAIAAAAVATRGRVTGDRTLHARLGSDAGMALLQEVERQLNALIAVGAVPPRPDPSRRGLTS